MESATITSASITKNGNVITWNFSSDQPIEKAWMEVKSKDTGGKFKPTVGTDGKNSVSEFKDSDSGIFTDIYKPQQGRTYMLVVLRKDWSRFTSNQVEAK